MIKNKYLYVISTFNVRLVLFGLHGSSCIK